MSFFKTKPLPDRLSSRALSESILRTRVVMDRVGMAGEIHYNAVSNCIQIVRPNGSIISIMAETMHAPAAMQQMLQSLVGQVGGQGGGQVGEPNRPKVDATMLLRQRLGGLSGTLNIKSSDFLHCHVTDSRVVVLFIFNDKEGHVSDDIALFPSDTLITQLRMVM